MIYLNNNHISIIKGSWLKYADIITEVTKIQSQKLYHQPIKPYLRFKNPANRIIAMPAYIGGKFNVCGIKWIASFPDNLKNNIKRAHSVTILNDSETGIPLSIIDSSAISGIRTAAVSASLIHHYLKFKKSSTFNIGIMGFGPIAQFHIEMLKELLGTKIEQIKVFDIETNKYQDSCSEKLSFCATWEQAYEDADLLITCTSSRTPYINLEPKPGSLHLNVSLRDYQPEITINCPHIVVDDWEEVCRESTDIEIAHQKYGLTKEQTSSLSEFLAADLSKSISLSSDYICFHPMGMAIFDVAIAQEFYHSALQKQIGINLSNLEASLNVSL